MITGLRSAILCDSVVTRSDGSVDLVGLWGEHLIADSKPGILRPWLALTLDLTGQGADGEVLIEAPEFQRSMSFQTPPGPKMALAAFPILLPIVAVGLFVVSVVDLQAPGNAFIVEWGTGFAAGAQDLDTVYL